MQVNDLIQQFANRPGQAAQSAPKWGDQGANTLMGYFSRQLGMQPQQSSMSYGGPMMGGQGFGTHPAMNAQPTQRFQSPFAQAPQMSLAQLLMNWRR